MRAENKLLLVLLSLYAAIILLLLEKRFLHFDSTFLLGVCLAPYVLISAPERAKSLRFFPLVLAFVIVSFLVKAQSFRYFLIIVSLIFTLESLKGKLNILLFYLLIVISPIFKYLSEVFTFPIRIKLGEWSGILLRSAGFDVETSGNLIRMNGQDFSVDPACMGLQMLGFSFLTGIFLITHFQRVTKKELPSYLITLIMILIIPLNITANLGRILTLIICRISSESPFHDVVGLFYLFAYVWLPLAVLVKYFFRKYGNERKTQVSISLLKPTVAVLNVAFSIVCGLLVLQKPVLNISKQLSHANFAEKKYEVRVLQNGITRFRSPDALIYEKGIPDFYSTDHSPYTCWKGSGYKFTSIREQIISGKTVYFGMLEKGPEKLQTAWWFSNNDHVTISQLDWRWRVLRGERGFQLINVTTTNEENLKPIVQEWLSKRT
jgi:exosortase N